ncbi:hypothetical protein GCM10011380_03540 [Sphingomonas metalli]|uniref:Uncharacterized protein n=1 Tax=Sphingomonas metalli TaxID=1779358 RepID=A0A916SU92_9SPHN|nr:hypothetical protein [Sphingomonas metalli]GGB17314.1 hypothetical protein GCM10011380_03540 [Sphingomonas metalli]
MTRALWILPAAVLLAAPLTARTQRDPFAGRVAGTPQQCIPVSQTQGGTVIDQNTIVYEGLGGRKYRVSPIGPCPFLRPMTILITQIYGGQLCRNDRFQTIEPGMTIPSAYCRFGEFVPYSKPKKQ